MPQPVHRMQAIPAEVHTTVNETPAPMHRCAFSPALDRPSSTPTVTHKKVCGTLLSSNHPLGCHTLLHLHNPAGPEPCRHQEPSQHNNTARSCPRPQHTKNNSTGGQCSPHVFSGLAQSSSGRQPGLMHCQSITTKTAGDISTVARQQQQTKGRPPQLCDLHAYKTNCNACSRLSLQTLCRDSPTGALVTTRHTQLTAPQQQHTTVPCPPL